MNRIRPAPVCALLLAVLLLPLPAPAQPLVKGDSRVRTVLYDPDRVYALSGFVGYQIDLEFEPGESFVGLGAGDVEALSFVAQDNHLFLKPRAERISTNLTVLTTRRHYYFDYTARPLTAGLRSPGLLYALRFTYPPPPAAASPAHINQALQEGASLRPLNLDYWYCGAPSLKPLAAMDDGVHTRLRFGARSELPAVFVANEDGTESLVNYSIEDGDVLVHRVVRRLILRRGQLAGCVVNKSYSGGGERLDSGTVAPQVERATKGGRSDE
jgi:type IV secretion system protein VirB9